MEKDMNISPNAKRLTARLEVFADLADGWDGGAALSTGKPALKAAREIIRGIADEDDALLRNAGMFPANDGGIYLRWRKRVYAIDVPSLYINKDGKVTMIPCRMDVDIRQSEDTEHVARVVCEMVRDDDRRNVYVRDIFSKSAFGETIAVDTETGGLNNRCSFNVLLGTDRRLRPVLRPMSDLHDDRELREDFHTFCEDVLVDYDTCVLDDGKVLFGTSLNSEDIGRIVDWFDERGLDHRCLISMGLAEDIHKWEETIEEGGHE